MYELTNMTALITGSGQGVGFGIASVLAHQGARVLINDIDRARASRAAEHLRSEGNQAEPMPFDVTDFSQVQTQIEGIHAKGSRIDILVNNVGNAGNTPMLQKPFREMQPSEWKNFIDVNLYGVIHCTKAVLDGMCERGFGRIITISSEAGRMGLGIGVSLYGAAKAGAAHLMRHVAHEVGPFGVTANVVALGLMNNVPDAFSTQLIPLIPTHRLGDPLDVGYAVAFLASEEAGWVTGHTLVANGGFATF